VADVFNKEDVELDALYRDTVLDHYRSPRGRHALDRIDATRAGYNPLCGDRLTVSLKLDGETIAGVAVDGKGCAISMASGSMLSELLPGKTISEAHALGEAFRGIMHGRPAPADLDMGDLDALEGVRNFPVRVKCALLAWVTMDDALRRVELGDDPSTGVTVTEEGNS